MMPFERLRSLVRWSGHDQLELAVEAGDCLAEFASDPAGLVVGCRRLVEHHPEVAPLWWLCSRVLAASDPRQAALDAVDALAADPTPRRLADCLPFPHDGPVAVIGWPPVVSAAVVARPDLDLVTVSAPDAVADLSYRLRRIEQPLEVLTPQGAAERRPTHVLAEPAAVGQARDPAAPPPVLVDEDSHRELNDLAAAGAEVWLVVGVGRVLPERLFDVVAGANHGRLEAWTRAGSATVVGSDGIAPWGARSLVPDCPVAPELLRPFPT